MPQAIAQLSYLVKLYAQRVLILKVVIKSSPQTFADNHRLQLTQIKILQPLLQSLVVSHI